MKAGFKKIICLSGFLLMAGCSTPAPDYNMYKISEDDVLILLSAKSLLEDKGDWIRNEDTRCDLDATQWTLFCALQKASYNVLGEYQLRRAALEEVRVVVEQVAGRTFERRLIDFNNSPETSFEDIQKALDIALFRIEAKLAAS